MRVLFLVLGLALFMLAIFAWSTWRGLQPEGLHAQPPAAPKLRSQEGGAGGVDSEPQAPAEVGLEVASSEAPWPPEPIAAPESELPAAQEGFGPVVWARDEASELRRRLRDARAALQSDPFSAGALRELANASAAAGHWSVAVQALERLRFVLPEDDEVRFDLGAALLRSKRWLAATEVFDELTTRRPQDARVWFNLAIARQEVGHLQAARAAWDATIQLAPTAEALARRGELLSDLGLWEQAVADFEAVLAREPAAVEAELNLAHALAESGAVEAAYTRLREICADYPQLELAWRRMLRMGLRLWGACAKGSDRCDRLGSELRVACQRLLVLAPDDTEATRVLAELDAER